MTLAKAKDLNIIKLYTSSVKQMHIITAKPKKWGNSLGIILPADLVKEKRWTTEDEVRLIVMPKGFGSLQRLQGKLKTDKTVQQLKDDAREGWR